MGVWWGSFVAHTIVDGTIYPSRATNGAALDRDSLPTNHYINLEFHMTKNTKVVKVVPLLAAAAKKAIAAIPKTMVDAFNKLATATGERATTLAGIGEQIDNPAVCPIFPTLKGQAKAKYATWKEDNVALAKVFTEQDWDTGTALINAMRLHHEKHGDKNVRFANILGETKKHCMYWAGTGKTIPAVERAIAAGLKNPQGSDLSPKQKAAKKAVADKKKAAAAVEKDKADKNPLYALQQQLSNVMAALSDAQDREGVALKEGETGLPFEDARTKMRVVIKMFASE